MLRNLLAEIGRNRIKQIDIAKALKVNEKTLRNKLNQITAFTFPETVIIRDEFFPDLDLEYLFANSDDSPSEPKVG